MAHGQAGPPALARGLERETRLYIGLEGNMFANRPTQLTSTSSAFSTGHPFLEPRPALVAGYVVTPRFAVEIAPQFLPVATTHGYQDAEFQTSASYSNDYLYVPVRGAFRVLGLGHRFGISVLGGGGPAWTDLAGGSLQLVPSYTATSTITQPDGSTKALTETQTATQEKASFFVLEAGLRGHWLVLPHLALDLTIRQLWGLGGSVRDLQLAVRSDFRPGATATATLATPVVGLCTGLGLRYFF